MARNRWTRRSLVVCLVSVVCLLTFCSVAPELDWPAAEVKPVFTPPVELYAPEGK